MDYHRGGQIRRKRNVLTKEREKGVPFNSGELFIKRDLFDKYFKLVIQGRWTYKELRTIIKRPNQLKYRRTNEQRFP